MAPWSSRTQAPPSCLSSSVCGPVSHLPHSARRLLMFQPSGYSCLPPCLSPSWTLSFLRAGTGLQPHPSTVPVREGPAIHLWPSRGWAALHTSSRACRGFHSTNARTSSLLQSPLLSASLSRPLVSGLRTAGPRATACLGHLPCLGGAPRQT